MTKQYVVVAGTQYPIGTLEKVAAVHRAMIAAGVASVAVLRDGAPTGQIIKCPVRR